MIINITGSAATPRLNAAVDGHKPVEMQSEVKYTVAFYKGLRVWCCPTSFHPVFNVKMRVAV